MKQFRINSLLRELEGIRDRINKTIENIKIVKGEDKVFPRCANCRWRNLRIRKDKTYFCMSCGYDSREKRT